MPKQTQLTTQLVRAKSRRPSFLARIRGLRLATYGLQAARPWLCHGLTWGLRHSKPTGFSRAPQFALALRKQSLRFTFSDPRLTTHFATGCSCNSIWIQIVGEAKCLNSRTKSAFGNAFGLHLHPNAKHCQLRKEPSRFENLTSKETNACQLSQSF